MSEYVCLLATNTETVNLLLLDLLALISASMKGGGDGHSKIRSLQA